MNNLAKHWGGDIRYVVPPTKLLGGGHVPPRPPGFGAFLTKMEVGICENDIRAPFHLGKWSMNGDARPETSPRPMLVQLTNRTEKKLDYGKFV